jgi:hypothetical protein
LNFAKDALLLPTAVGRTPVEEFLRDAPVEVVRVHDVDTCLDLPMPGSQLFDGLLPRGVFDSHQRVAQMAGQNAAPTNQKLRPAPPDVRFECYIHHANKRARNQRQPQVFE